METAALRVQRTSHRCSVRVQGVVNGALVREIRQLTGQGRQVCVDLQEAMASADGLAALQAWRADSGGQLELTLPGATSGTDPRRPGPPPAATEIPTRLSELLAHEVRGPLTVAHLQMQTLAARMAARGQAAEAASCRGALAGLDAVSRLFETYLTANRSWQARPVNLAAVASAAAQAARDSIGDGDVAVTSCPAPSCWVKGERQALHQLIFNLARNGLQAAGSGAQLRIAITRADPGRCVLTVTDNGPGFAAEILAAPFEQRQSHKPGGMGIGLLLCRWIATRHGAALHLSNTPDGARIVVDFPATADPGAGSEAGARSLQRRG